MSVEFYIPDIRACFCLVERVYCALSLWVTASGVAHGRSEQTAGFCVSHRRTVARSGHAHIQSTRVLEGKVGFAATFGGSLVVVEAFICKSPTRVAKIPLEGSFVGYTSLDRLSFTFREMGMDGRYSRRALLPHY
jgi:hypothetical protein